MPEPTLSAMQQAAAAHLLGEGDHQDGRHSHGTWSPSALVILLCAAVGGLCFGLIGLAMVCMWMQRRHAVAAAEMERTIRETQANAAKQARGMLRVMLNLKRQVKPLLVADPSMHSSDDLSTDVCTNDAPGTNVPNPQLQRTSFRRGLTRSSTDPQLQRASVTRSSTDALLVRHPRRAKREALTAGMVVAGERKWLAQKELELRDNRLTTRQLVEEITGNSGIACEIVAEDEEDEDETVIYERV